MLGLTWEVVAAYCAFSGLLFYVQKHGANYQGESQAIGAALTIVGLLGLLAQLAFMGCVWWQHSFLTMLALFGIAIGSSILLVIAEAVLRVPFFILSMFGMVTSLPLAALSFYLLFR